MARLFDFELHLSGESSEIVLVFDDGPLPFSAYAFLNDGPEGDRTNLRRSLATLLVRWRNLVAAAQAGETVFLPFFFDDQSIHWLRCRVTPEDCALQVGWTPQEGMRIRPSQWTPEALSPEGFERAPGMRTVRGQRGALLADIDRVINQLRTDR